jgi:hypothetical protein
VQRSLRIKNYHAIKAALRRYAQELREMNMGIEKHASSDAQRELSYDTERHVSVIITPDEKLM